MARIVKGGLIQASNPIPGDEDLEMIREVRDLRQFYRDRRPDSYDQLLAR